MNKYQESYENKSCHLSTFVLAAIGQTCCNELVPSCHRCSKNYKEPLSNDSNSAQKNNCRIVLYWRPGPNDWTWCHVVVTLGYLWMSKKKKSSLRFSHCLHTQCHRENCRWTDAPKVRLSLLEQKNKEKMIYPLVHQCSEEQLPDTAVIGQLMCRCAPSWTYAKTKSQEDLKGYTSDGACSNDSSKPGQLEYEVKHWSDLNPGSVHLPKLRRAQTTFVITAETEKKMRAWPYEQRKAMDGTNVVSKNPCFCTLRGRPREADTC